MCGVQGPRLHSRLALGEGVSDLSPQEWFDQFSDWYEAQTVWPPGSQWCARHWAPAPRLGANGLGATTALMQIWVNEIKPAELGPKDTDAMNQRLLADSPLCCKLGDERMYELWGEWPPPEGR